MKYEGLELVVIFSTLIILLVLFIMIIIYVGFIRKKSELILKQQETDLKFEQELAISLMEMKEHTLSHVGRELHDDLGQKLTVAKLLTNTMLPKLQNDEREKLQDINRLIGECITDIRNLSKTFITDQVEHFGFIHSLEREIKRIEKLEIYQISFVCNNEDIDINSKHGVILFRIVQECISNVMKHSKAREMKIVVFDAEQELKIRIQDNGKGFYINQNNEGSGVKNMKNRAKMINAKFHITSEINEGTEVRIVYHK